MVKVSNLYVKFTEVISQLITNVVKPSLKTYKKNNDILFSQHLLICVVLESIFHPVIVNKLLNIITKRILFFFRNVYSIAVISI